MAGLGPAIHDNMLPLRLCLRGCPAQGRAWRLLLDAERVHRVVAVDVLRRSDMRRFWLRAEGAGEL